MKHLTTILSLVLLAALVGGCTEYVVRDAAVYQTELNQYDSWATKQAALLKGFMASSCTCDAAQKFTTTECADAADFVLTIESRHEWHKAMSLYLAGLTEDRPPKDPPEIPLSSTLCPTTTPTEGGE